jgi:hypothetical protein
MDGLKPGDLAHDTLVPIDLFGQRARDDERPSRRGARRIGLADKWRWQYWAAILCTFIPSVRLAYVMR